MGTSTGGIIGIALGLGYRASDVLDFYEEHGPKIFGGPRFARRIRQIFRSKYGPEALRTALTETIGSKLIGDSRTRLVVPTWNPQAKSVYVYKTAHHPRFRTDYRSPAIDAAMATSAASTIFPPHVTKQGASLIDGGIWANNPAAIAAVEAIAVLKWPAESLSMLSLGCLDETYTVHKRSGLVRIGLNAVKLFMDGQSNGSLGMTRLLLGHEHDRQSLHRIDYTVPQDQYKFDDAKVIDDLKGLGHSLGRDRKPVLTPTFFDTTAEEFIPCYTL